MSLLNAASQPLVAIMSQLPKPALHATTWHPPVTQAPTALLGRQLTLQPPQCVVLVPRLASQPLRGLPSQSEKPALHTKPQAPAEQVGEVFAKEGQAVPHIPQLEGSVATSAHTPLATQ